MIITSAIRLVFSSCGSGMCLFPSVSRSFKYCNPIDKCYSIYLLVVQRILTEEFSMCQVVWKGYQLEVNKLSEKSSRQSSQTLQTIHSICSSVTCVWFECWSHLVYPRKVTKLGLTARGVVLVLQLKGPRFSAVCLALPLRHISAEKSRCSAQENIQLAQRFSDPMGTANEMYINDHKIMYFKSWGLGRPFKTWRSINLWLPWEVAGAVPLQGWSKRRGLAQPGMASQMSRSVLLRSWLALTFEICEWNQLLGIQYCDMFTHIFTVFVCICVNAACMMNVHICVRYMCINRY